MAFITTGFRRQPEERKTSLNPGPYLDSASSSGAAFPLLLGRRGGGSSDDSRKEGRTGADFPRNFCHISKSDCPRLVGVGSRRKRLLGMKNIDVYALGLYVDEKATQKVLKAQFPGAEATALSKDQSLCEEVINAQELEKTLRIVITSGMVNHERFVGALKESLQPACEKEGDVESLPQFEQLFDGAQFKKGMELAFTNTKSGGLAAKIDNRDVGEVGSKSFTKAFFSLYLGDSPVSKEGKDSISKGLAELASNPSVDPTEPGNEKEKAETSQ